MVVNNQYVKEFQKQLNLRYNSGLNEDGDLGKKTLTAFGKAYGLNNVQIVQSFANMHHESKGFTIKTESLNYTTVSRLMKIFGYPNHSAAIRLADAPNWLRKPYELGERVYGLGNPKKAKELGNTAPGDGYKFRGRWALQTTGKAAYKRYGEMIGLNLVDNPDSYYNEAYFLTAIAEFQDRKIWALMKDYSKANIELVRRKINGGLNGIEEVKTLIQFYKHLLI